MAAATAVASRDGATAAGRPAPAVRCAVQPQRVTGRRAAADRCVAFRPERLVEISGSVTWSSAPITRRARLGGGGGRNDNDAITRAGSVFVQTRSAPGRCSISLASLSQPAASLTFRYGRTSRAHRPSRRPPSPSRSFTGLLPARRMQPPSHDIRAVLLFLIFHNYY